MKKIITILTLLLAFTISSNAQNKTVSPEIAAKKDLAAAELKFNFVGDQAKKLYDLMLIKHEGLADPLLTPETKADLYKRVDRNLRKVLKEANYNYLLKNPELKEQLSH